jgi:hypothetical protein
LPSEDDLSRVNNTGQTPAAATGLMTANPNVVASRQTVSSKDDASIASGSSGCGSLTKKKAAIAGSEYLQAFDVDPQSIVSSIITDSGISESPDTPLMMIFDRASSLAPVSSSQNLSAQQQNAGEMGHSRNSSNTSQVSFRKFQVFTPKNCQRSFFRCRRDPVTAVASPIDNNILDKVLMVIRDIRGELKSVNSSSLAEKSLFRS